jgi:hypothetical protein
MSPSQIANGLAILHEIASVSIRWKITKTKCVRIRQFGGSKEGRKDS